MADGKRRLIRFHKATYARGDTVPVSAIYECSECENVSAFKKGETFPVCEHCHSEDEEQRWHRTNHLIHFVSKNLNTEYGKLETFGIRASDWTAEFVGSWPFIILFLLFMAIWIGANIYAWVHVWDPYPFILLNLILSTIAAIQAPLILMSQNRQGEKSELRAELDYQTNLSTEKDVAEVLSILHELRKQGRQLAKRTEEVFAEVRPKGARRTRKRA